MQPNLHSICCKLNVWEKENAIYKIYNNLKTSLKLKNKWKEVETKNSRIDFDYKHRRPRKSKAMVIKSKL